MSTNANGQGDSVCTNATDWQWLGNYNYDAAGNRIYDDENGTLSQPSFDAENRHISYGFNNDGDVTVGVADNGIWQNEIAPVLLTRWDWAIG